MTLQIIFLVDGKVCAYDIISRRLKLLLFDLCVALLRRPQMWIFF